MVRTERVFRSRTRACLGVALSIAALSSTGVAWADDPVDRGQPVAPAAESTPPTSPAHEAAEPSASAAEADARASTPEPRSAEATPPAARSGDGSAPAPAERPKVRIALRSDDSAATLEERVATESPTMLGMTMPVGSLATWRPICTAPCTAEVSADIPHRVGGDGLVPSRSFVPRAGNNVAIDAKMGSAPGRVGGAVLAFAGAGGMLLGGALAVTSPILASQDVGSPELRSGMLAGGLAVAGVGLVATAAGIYLYLSNQTSVVETQGGVGMQAKKKLPKPNDGVKLTVGGLVF